MLINIIMYMNEYSGSKCGRVWEFCGLISIKSLIKICYML